jgi:hypothetical protein
MIMLAEGNKEDRGVFRPTEPVAVSKLTVLPKPDVKSEKPPKEVPQDQIGNCDNLTASYWG